jgi:hypothetical protein
LDVSIAPVYGEPLLDDLDLDVPDGYPDPAILKQIYSKRNLDCLRSWKSPKLLTMYFREGNALALAWLNAWARAELRALTRLQAQESELQQQIATPSEDQGVVETDLLKLKPEPKQPDDFKKRAAKAGAAPRTSRRPGRT